MKAVIVLIIVLALGLGFFLLKQKAVAPTPIADNGAGNDAPNPAGGTVQSLDDLIRVTAPTNNASIKSPLTVKGEARGYWYFEASFPVKLLDANGKELGVVPAQAKGDWMTTEFVPFEATLTFSTPTTATGVLVFMKDNPSGLPENDRSLEVPVVFTK